MTDYELEYRRNDKACGDPFPEVVRFFDELDCPGARVLDLGCGQGRDAIMIAERGFDVLGIDLSPTGIRQLNQAAKSEKLPLVGEAADILSYPITGDFDVVLLDRVVHMFASRVEQAAVLEKATRAVGDSGTVVLVDTPKNLPWIDNYFAQLPGWQIQASRKGFRAFTLLRCAA